MALWPKSWLEDGSCTSESFFWLMQVWAGSVVFCRRTCCPVVHPADIAEGRCSSPTSPLWITTFTNSPLPCMERQAVVFHLFLYSWGRALSLMKWDISLWTRETCLPHRNCYDRYVPGKGLFCHITILQPEEIISPTSQPSSQHLSIIFSDRRDKIS